MTCYSRWSPLRPFGHAHDKKEEPKQDVVCGCGCAKLFACVSSTLVAVVVLWHALDHKPPTMQQGTASVGSLTQRMQSPLHIGPNKDASTTGGLPTALDGEQLHVTASGEPSGAPTADAARQRLVLSDIHQELLDVPYPPSKKPIKKWKQAEGSNEPPPFYSRPLVWPEEAVKALANYTAPDLESVLLGEPIKPFELVVNRTLFPLYPRGMLVVTTGQDVDKVIVYKFHKPFADDLKRFILALPERYHTIPFVTWTRDYHHQLPFPILTKARVVDDPNGVLLPLKHTKHFKTFLTKLPPDNIAFRDKQFGVVWRGTDSGNLYSGTSDPGHSRHQLVQRWSRYPNSNINIAFAGSRAFTPDKHAKYWGDEMSIVEQRKYRYLLSAEGHDVATGTKWMLDSNSVVLMPPPTREIWSLEGQLKAWVHYVPVRRDYADLWDRMMLCEAFMDKCEAISKRATEFIAFFKDHERTQRLAVARVKEYLDNVKITLVE